MLPSGGELVLVLLLTLGPCVAVALAASLLLRRHGGRSLRDRVLVGAGAALAAVLAGTAVVSRAMFLSPHDLGLLALVLVVSAVFATGWALVLARSLAREGARLVEAAAAVGGDGPVWSGPPPATAELAAVAEQLERTNDELAAARQAQRQAEQAREELVSWMSHDLRTPLAGIRAMAEALEDDVVADPADVHTYHTQMRRDADRLAAMVDDLFELSRLDAGRSGGRREAVDLRALAAEILVGCQATEPGRPLLLHTDGAVPAVVSGCQQDLSRVLRNLVTNAQRYSPTDQPVHVRITALNQVVEVAVEDVCGGIPPRDVPRVFDVGFRGGAARTPDERAGAGLGLAIAQRLVEAHGGTLAVQPRPGGCCFSATFPALRADVPAAAGTPAAARSEVPQQAGGAAAPLRRWS